MNQSNKARAEYQTPCLEAQANYTLTTGISLPVGTNIPDSFEMTDVLGEEL